MKSPTVMGRVCAAAWLAVSLVAGSAAAAAPNEAAFRSFDAWLQGYRAARASAADPATLSVAADRKSTRLNSSHYALSRMPSSA